MMAIVDLSTAVKVAAEKMKERDIQDARKQVEAQIDGRAWNMNQPLNMIAYEDQR
ncbi:hypothetical protein [Burkholderia sp. SRS-W-2-2016]|uniref:hypothetical protein n=1 Tax=Burkholderia sp. SRS-W-2-2016 TaxID=1926878 RepID=UPI0015BD0882|nr:hypothetical protein [Burkholderia sp. SRS-W-2-2016]